MGGGQGGYYTKDQYRDLVEYARNRFIAIIPEIDLPGHTNAALASYAELNCDGVAPPLFAGTDVGFSSLCVSKEVVYQFLDEVIRELAAVSPSPYIHIGGDEALSHLAGRALQVLPDAAGLLAHFGLGLGRRHRTDAVGRSLTRLLGRLARALKKAHRPSIYGPRQWFGGR